MSSTPTPLWLVTGASSGLGHAIALAALRQGFAVIASARNPKVAAENHPDIEVAGGRWLRLDITEASTEETVSRAVEEAGRIDVLVNNAGFTALGSIEDFTVDESKDVFDALFFGQIRVLKGVLPKMRAQQKGHIYNMSSIFGISPSPSGALYSSAKFAIEGLSETLGLELAPFNVGVTILEPGFFSTSMMGTATVKRPEAGMREDFANGFLGQVDAFYGQLEDPKFTLANAPGDPVKLGKLVVEHANGAEWSKQLTARVQRLTLGSDALAVFERKLQATEKDFAVMKDIGRTTDHGGTSATGINVDWDSIIGQSTTSYKTVS